LYKEILFKIRVHKCMIHIVSHVLKTKRLIIVIIIAIKNRCKEVFIKSSFTIPYQIKYFVSFINAVFKANLSFFSQNLFKMPLYRKFPFILVTDFSRPML